MTKQQSKKSEFEASSMPPYEIQERNSIHVSEVINDDDDLNIDDDNSGIKHPDGVNLIDNDDSVSSDEILMKEVNMDEETLDDISFIKYMIETDTVSVEEIDQNDMMSLVSTSDCENDIYDFGEDIIPSEDEIKEENTQHAILGHDQTDGNMR